jgi:hypothetical protein
MASSNSNNDVLKRRGSGKFRIELAMEQQAIMDILKNI